MNMDDWGATDFANCDIEIKEEPLDDLPDDAQEAESTEAALCFESVDVTSRDNLDYDAYPQACASFEDNLRDPLCDDSSVKSVMPSQDTHKHLSKDPFYHPFKVKLEPVSYETPSDLFDAASKTVNGSAVSTDASNKPIESVLKIKEEKPDPDLHFEQPSGSCSLLNSLEPWQVNPVPPLIPIPPREEQQSIFKVKETAINNELQSSFPFSNASKHNGKNIGELAAQNSTLDQKDNKTLFLTYANNIHGSSPVHQTSLIIADTNLQTVNRKKSVYVPIRPFAENSPLRQAFGSYTQSKPLKHKTDILLLSKPKKLIQPIPSSTYQQKLIEQLPSTPPVLNHKSRKQILTPRVEIPSQLKIKISRQNETPERKCFTTSSRRVLNRMIDANTCDISEVKSRELLALQSWNWCKPKNIEGGELPLPDCQVEQRKYSSDCSEDKEKPITVKQELEDVCLADRLKTLSDKVPSPRVSESVNQEVESKHSVETNISDNPSVVEVPRKPRKQSLQTTRVINRAAKRKEHEECKVKMTPVVTLPKCSTCDLKFYNRYDYLEHIRFAHLVMYKCDFCAYEVGNDKSAISYHIKRHLDELEQHLPSVS
ncbi:hypothetical protein B566_EDAN011312 [Ephemera danica]|nr:hypothetical protein B566_EDAN011312 [Ephemera danica]